MIVRRLRIRGLSRHADTSISFPPRGVILITGINGSGKSTIAESVAWAVWGKSLRGEPLWSEKRPAEVSLDTDAFSVTRRRTPGGTHTLRWSAASGPSESYDTRTKAQEALDGFAGGFDEWRRAHVFSSSDAANFTTATDAERKRLLQTVLGLGVFDEALESVRKDLREAAPELSRASSSEALAEANIRSAREAEADARRDLAAIPAPQPLPPEPAPPVLLPLPPRPEPPEPYRERPPDVAALDAAVRAAERAAESAKEDVGAAQTKLARLRAASAALDSELVAERLRGAFLLEGKCPTCEQPATDAVFSRFDDSLKAVQVRVEALRTKIASDTEAAERRLEARTSAREGAVVAVAAALKAREAALTGYKARMDAEAASRAARLADAERQWRADSAAAEEANRLAVDGHRRETVWWRNLAQQTAVVERQREAAEKRVAVSSHNVLLRAASAEELAAKSATLRATVAVWQASETVLGLRGVRASVLGRALEGLGHAANAWLSRLGLPNIRVALSPYTEQASGGVSECIALGVSGAGGGHGYAAASGGERRRIDVGLLLALGELASGSGGRAPGTLWFDEVFDALDEEGVRCAAGVLHTLAQERSVVVVSHSARLASLLSPAVHVRTESLQLLEAT